ncbi:hypothetical protein B0H13DRAFT_2046705, partial [Mycena leptocephala]
MRSPLPSCRQSSKVAACRRFGTPRRARRRRRSRPRWARVRAAGAEGCGGIAEQEQEQWEVVEFEETLYSPIGGASFLAFFHFVHSRPLHSPFALAFSILPTPLLVDSFPPFPHWPRRRIVSIIPHPSSFHLYRRRHQGKCSSSKGGAIHPFTPIGFLKRRLPEARLEKKILRVWI